MPSSDYLVKRMSHFSTYVYSISAFSYAKIALWRNKNFDEEGEDFSFSLPRRIITELIIPVVAVVGLGETVARIILIIPLFLAGILAEYLKGGGEYLSAGITIAIYGPVACLAATLVSISGIWNNFYNSPLFFLGADNIIEETMEMTEYIKC